jgi:hypothetical protein
MIMEMMIEEETQKIAHAGMKRDKMLSRGANNYFILFMEAETRKVAEEALFKANFNPEMVVDEAMQRVVGEEVRKSCQVAEKDLDSQYLADRVVDSLLGGLLGSLAQMQVKQQTAHKE